MTVMKWWHLNTPLKVQWLGSLPFPVFIQLTTLSLSFEPYPNLPTSKVRSPNSSRHRHREASSSGKVSRPASRCGNATLTNGTTARPQFSTTRYITGETLITNSSTFATALSLVLCVIPGTLIKIQTSKTRTPTPSLKSEPSVGTFGLKVNPLSCPVVAPRRWLQNPNRARSIRYEKVVIYLPLDHEGKNNCVIVGERGKALREAIRDFWVRRRLDVQNFLNHIAS
ncbi:hypothetical protein B0T13DRAFT_445641 [Neurospora crassa]|nr:hypothetical protein B0T13DRAFT_445641 [Neurospora crassa]